MKKTILLLFSALLTLSSFAQGTGDGLSQESAIAFDWTNGNVHPGGGAALWYRVPLAPIYDEEDPTLALYLTNLSYNSADVTISAIIAGSEEVRNYTIDARKDRVWSQSAKMLVRMKYTEILVQLTSTERIKLSASVFDAEDADETCTSATDYNWNDHNVNAGNRWYRLNLAEARANNQEIQITYSATEACELNSTISPNCPSTGLTGDAALIPAGGSYTHVITRALIQNLADDELFLKVENFKRVSVHTDRINPPVIDPDFNYSGAVEGKLLTDYDIPAAGQSYYIALDSLKRKKLQPEIAFINDSNKTTVANVKVYIAFSNVEGATLNTKESKVIVKEITVPVGETAAMDFEKNMIDGLNAETAKYIYVMIVPSQDIKARARLKHMHEGDACKHSQELSWNSTTYQDGESTVWYAIDVTEAKDAKNPQNIVVTVTNRASARAYVTADLAFECPYIDLQSISRQLNANQSISKTIGYSMFGMMSSDIIYIGVTTDQPIKVDVMMTPVEKHAADDKCLSAEPFDWTYGHQQAAGDSIWYKVGVNDIRNSNLIPEVIITNKGNSTVTIFGELSLDCPDSIANESRQMTIAANGTYTRQISRDYFRNIQNDTVYILLTANQPFSFRVNQIREDEGASCASATLFNWVSGNDQDAETTVWYKASLKDVKAAQGKKLHSIIKNFSSTKKAEISAMLAATCPCETPQAQSFSIAAGKTEERDMARSMFETFGDTVYFRITTSTKIHFEAQLVDADPFDTIFVCDPALGAQEIQFGKMYNQTQDTAWYFVVTAPILAKQDSTPQLHIINGSTAQSITANVAYHCPVTEEMMAKSQSFNANQELYKTIERSLAEQVAGKDTVYIRIIGKGAFQFEVKMIDPNNGNDCRHALTIAPGEPVYTKAGETAWYRFNVGKYGVENAEDKLEMIIGNMNGKAGKVTASIYDACEGGLIQEGSATLNANLVRRKEFMCEQLTGLNTEWIYLHIYTEQDDSLLMRLIPRADIDTIWACQNAIPFAINTDYSQKAGDTIWYSVNVKDLRENTMGDATLTINNLSDKANAISAQVSWACPVTKEMTSKGQTVAAKSRYVRVIERSNIDLVKNHDVAYVRVISPEDMTFRIDLALSKGSECSNPVEFDWVNGNTNPKGECIWYNVPMVKDTVIDGKDTTAFIIPEGKDLRLNIQNLGDVASNVEASVFFECRDTKAAGDYNNSLSAGQTKSKVISRRRIEPNHPTSLIVRLCSPNAAMHITVDFVSAVTDTIYDTIRVAYCDQDDYTDQLTNRVITIDKNNSETLQWTDTIHGNVEAAAVDSFITFVITPMVSADSIKHAALPDSVKLVAAQGMKLDWKRLSDYLAYYYDSVTVAADSLADYQAIEFSAIDPADGKWRPIDKVTAFDDVLDKSITNITIAYIASTECGAAQIVDTIPLAVNPWRQAQWNGVEYVCQGAASFTWRGMTINTDKDSVYRDTVFNVTAIVDTLARTLPRQLDSIYSLTVTLKQKPVLPTQADINMIFRMDYHSDIAKDSLDDLTVLINGHFTNNYSDEDYAQPTNVRWQRKNLSDGTYADFQVGVNDTIIKDAQVVLRYVVTTECGDEINSEDINYAPVSDCPEFDASQVAITWPEAYCRAPYADNVVVKTIQDAMDADAYVGTITLYYRYKSTDAWQVYNTNDTIKAAKGENVSFYAEVTNSCGNKSATTVITKTVNAPVIDDADYTVFNSLPAVVKYNGWLLMIDLNAIKTNYNFEPKEEDVAWYILKGAAPDPTGVDAPSIGTGYYLPLPESERRDKNYYALIEAPVTVTDECGGVYRTVIISKKGSSAPARVRKQVVDGKLYITTQDGVTYDAQGQKVER